MEQQGPDQRHNKAKRRRRRRPPKKKPVHLMTAEEKEELRRLDEERLNRKVLQQQNYPKDKHGRVKEGFEPPAPLLRLTEEELRQAPLPFGSQQTQSSGNDDELDFSGSSEDEGLEGIPNLLQRMASNDAPMKAEDIDAVQWKGKSQEDLLALAKHLKHDKAYWESRAHSAEARLTIQAEMLERGKRRERELRNRNKQLEKKLAALTPNGSDARGGETKRQKVEESKQ